MEGFLSLARLGGGGHLSTTHCLLAVTPCVALASLQCRGSTFEKLLWASLQARSDLLTRLHSEGAESVLRHCQQLSGLVSSTSSLSNTPQVRDLQMKVTHVWALSIARNFCAPKILQKDFLRITFLRIKLSTVKVGMVNKHLRIIFLRSLIRLQNFWAAEMSSYTVHAIVFQDWLTLLVPPPHTHTHVHAHTRPRTWFRCLS